MNNKKNFSNFLKLSFDKAIQLLKLKDKKGILITNAVKLIIAVICLILLIYLMVNLIGISIQKSKMQQAKANLDELEKRINELEEGKSVEFILLSPSGWVLFGFDAEKVAVIPEECKNTNWKKCLCLCYDDSNTPFTSCNYLGYCIEIKEKEFSVNPTIFFNYNQISVNDLLEKGEHLLIKKEKNSEGIVKLILVPEKDKGN